MRKRFGQQLGLGQLPIGAAYIDPKSKNALDELLSKLGRGALEVGAKPAKIAA